MLTLPTLCLTARQLRSRGEELFLLGDAVPNADTAGVRPWPTLDPFLYATLNARRVSSEVATAPGSLSASFIASTEIDVVGDR